MGLDMYLKVRKKDWKEHIPTNALGEDGLHIDDKNKFIESLGAKKVLDLILNKYLFVWQELCVSYVGLDTMKEIGYWRKANAIHNWFVKNVQDGKDDCGYYIVTSKQISELKKYCEIVYESLDDNDMTTITDEYGYNVEIYNNTKLAEDLLPTTSGFFFGEIQYTKYYKEDLLDTINICNECEYLGNDMEILYHSSW